MLSIHTNASSLSTQNALALSNKTLTTSLTRLGTGYRVNSAMDDAAGLQIAARLEAQSRGMKVAQRNTQNGISMMQSAEGSLAELTNVLLRMKDLASEAFTASAGPDDKAALQAEFDALGQELSNIYRTSAYGGQYLFTGSGSNSGEVAGLLGSSGGLDFQIGATANERMNVDTKQAVTDLQSGLDSISANFAAASTGTELTTTPVTSTELAIFQTINDAITDVGTLRAQLGAAANRLDHVFSNLGNMITQAEASRGRIMDVDYAVETTNSTAKQILLQAGAQSLKQSSSMSQLILSLMQ
jgi:flagellin